MRLVSPPEPVLVTSIISASMSRLSSWTLSVCAAAPPVACQMAGHRSPRWGVLRASATGHSAFLLDEPEVQPAERAGARGGAVPGAAGRVQREPPLARGAAAVQHVPAQL